MILLFQYLFEHKIILDTECLFSVVEIFILIFQEVLCVSFIVPVAETWSSVGFEYTPILLSNCAIQGSYSFMKE